MQDTSNQVNSTKLELFTIDDDTEEKQNDVFEGFIFLTRIFERYNFFVGRIQ